MKALIGIDAGHGGNYTGTYSYTTETDGFFEKDYALELALLIEKNLLENGFDVVMTRREDINPGTVIERAQMMTERKADFALSIHFNGFGSKTANGCEIYVPYAETAAEIEAGFRKVLTKYFRERKPFARSSNINDRNEIFDKKLNFETKRFDAVSDKKDYFGFIRTCWENGISADLLEVCFLTNPDDLKNYIENKEEIAEGIARSIVEAFGEKYSAEKKKKVKARKFLLFCDKRMHLWEKGIKSGFREKIGTR